MRKLLFKLFTLFIITFFIFSCEEDLIVYDVENGQTAISFAGSLSRSVSVPEDGITLNIPINSTTVSNFDRTFSVNVDAGTTGSSSHYNVGTASILANQHVGTLTVDFVFDTMVDGEQNQLILNLVAPEDGSSYRDRVVLNYFREIICNDVEVSITFDQWADETSWNITNSTGDIVASGGPYAGNPGGSTFTETIFLEDGCYTFTIFDQFGDGICCTYGEGSYSVSCSILEFASGGEFGASESTEFCVNQ